jgi:hypothetical protein
MPLGDEKSSTAENAENAERESLVLKTESLFAFSAFSAVHSFARGARVAGMK